MTNPDPVHLDKFGKMSSRFFSWFKNQIKIHQHLIKDWTFGEWLDQSDFSPEKKVKYLKTILSQKNGDITKFIGSFKTMVKQGEVYNYLGDENLDQF